MDFGSRSTIHEVYAKPWTLPAGGSLALTPVAGIVCAENEKDRAHLVGRTADEKKVVVAPEVLATYVGVYRTGAQTFNISLSDGQLLVDFRGQGKVPMIPLSQTMFSPRLLGTYEFVKNDRGIVTHMLVHSAEEVWRAERQR